MLDTEKIKQFWSEYYKLCGAYTNASPADRRDVGRRMVQLVQGTHNQSILEIVFQSAVASGMSEPAVAFAGIIAKAPSSANVAVLRTGAHYALDFSHTYPGTLEALLKSDVLPSEEIYKLLRSAAKRCHPATSKIAEHMTNVSQIRDVAKELMEMKTPGLRSLADELIRIADKKGRLPSIMLAAEGFAQSYPSLALRPCGP